MYEVTVFIYDYVTDKTFKKNRALTFQPTPGMIYKEKHTTEDNESHVWLADMLAIVADFQDYCGVSSEGYVVILGNLQSDTLLRHEMASWLTNTGWVDTEPPEGIVFDGPPLDDGADEDEECGPDEPE